MERGPGNGVCTVPLYNLVCLIVSTFNYLKPINDKHSEQFSDLSQGDSIIHSLKEMKGAIAMNF